jgi:Zn-dependent protease
MFRWLAKLLCGLTELVATFCFGLLLIWQALAIGVNYGLGACLLLCSGGLLGFLALLAVHELGHLLVAWMLGFPFQRFTVGPLQLVYQDARIRARLNTAWFQPAAYVMHTLPLYGNWRWRKAAFIFGGPASNLVLGAVCLVVASGINPGPPIEMPNAARAGLRSVAVLYPGDPATAGLNVAGLLSLGLGLGTLIPGAAAGLRTDGGQLLDIWRGTVSPGHDHRDTLKNMELLANSNADVGGTEEVLKLREETLLLQKANLGTDHPDTLVSMTNLASFLCCSRPD